MTTQLGYLAQGRLYLKLADGSVKEIASQFVRRANESARRDADRHAWKSRTSDGPQMMSSQMLWRRGAQRGLTQFQITGATRGANQEILFALHTNAIGGLFAHDVADGSERRLYHKQGFLGRHLARHPSAELVALSIRGDQMEMHIATTGLEGRSMRQVTEGDSVDECPAWVAGEKETIVFQSAGIARNAQGMQIGEGPYRIERLDLLGGKMETLIEDDRFDHLCPRVHADGSLYFIRRKWTPAARRVSWLSVIKDMLLFPFRLARAFVHFFNFFSTTFSGKPLLTSGGPPQAPRETTSMMLWGKLIDAEKLMKDMQPDSAVALVPADWELMRLAKGGKPQVVARSVGSFDLTADGGVIYTNGAAVFTLGREGVQTTVCTDRLIEGVWCWGAEG